MYTFTYPTKPREPLSSVKRVPLLILKQWIRMWVNCFLSRSWRRCSKPVCMRAHSRYSFTFFNYMFMHAQGAEERERGRKDRRGRWKERGRENGGRNIRSNKTLGGWRTRRVVKTTLHESRCQLITWQSHIGQKMKSQSRYCSRTRKAVC